MPTSYLVQGGTTLKRMTTSGGLTSLTLPTGVSLDSGKRLRGATLNNLTVLVGAASDNITVDLFDTVRYLCPLPPAMAPTLTTASGGSLTGTYTVKQTNIVKDVLGNLIAESSFGPVSGSQAVSSQYLVVQNIPIANQTISARRLYRTTTGGSTYFPWIDIDGNEVTSIQDDMSDASLQLVAAPTDLGAPPKFEFIAEWKDRLWGKSDIARDTLYYSAINKPYGWPAANTLLIPPANEDAIGITGFIPRKDVLGVGRRNAIYRITTSGNNVFTRVVETEGIGVWATDSVQVINDVGYFLGNPFGIYKWDNGGVTNISDAKVKAWFQTDTYFNRATFDDAVGMYDPNTHSYILLLSNAGDTTLNRWIQYDIAAGTWWGPHKTAEFTPTFAATLRDANDLAIPVFGASDGKLYKPTTTKTDGSSSAIDFDVTTNFISAGTPNILKVWLQPLIRTKIQSSGTLTVTPTVGDLDASAGTAISHDMTLGTETLRRLGKGEFVQLNFRNNTAAIDVNLQGVELPFNEIGPRS